MGDLTIHGTISLGGLIKALERIPLDFDIAFDFMRRGIAGFDSYRGFYDHLALMPSDLYSTVTVGQFLELCRTQIGAVHKGYKGGSYTMGRATPVWVADHGECPGTVILGVAHNRDRETAFIITSDVDVVGESIARGPFLRLS